MALTFRLGQLVGLAAMNGILLDLPIPPCVFKVLVGRSLGMTDLYEVDSQLASGLSQLLEFPADEVSYSYDP